MGSLVRYDFDGSVARITMNDGKVNVLSPEMLAELNEALSRAEANAGRYKITANEVAIGLTLPMAAIEICRQRLTPAHFSRATVLAEVFPPAGAVEAGFLDQAAGQEAGAYGHSRGHSARGASYAA